MTKTIYSPGFEFHEIDKSQYNKKINISRPNAPVCYLLGYADKGDDYVPQWINIKNTFADYYGYPTNEEERYFYNSALEIINTGGICIAAKLPYQNGQKQNYMFTEYSVEKKSINDDEFIYTQNGENKNCLYSIEQSDSSIENILYLKNKKCKETKYENVFNESGTMSNVELNSYLNKTTLPNENTIRIVDISHQRYSKSYNDTVYTTSDEFQPQKMYSNDCLGIVPVIVSPANAIYFQGLISSDEAVGATYFNNISAFVPCYIENMTMPDNEVPAANRVYVNTATESISSSLYEQFSDVDKSVTTVSKRTTDLFPLISWKDDNHFDRKWLKHIGIVVLKAFSDESNNNCINFNVVESFVGSLDYDEAQTNSKVGYIDDVVNQNSNFIRIFTNISRSVISQTQLAYVRNQRSTSLGFYDLQCKKTLTDSQTILNDIRIALSKMSNNTTQQIDVVVDAGITNIVQKVSSENTENGKWTLEKESDTIEWKKAVELFDNFCKNTRKDCMFINDCLKPLCIINDQKIVNPLVDITVEKAIIPKLKFLKRINSSYSAGYCNWFYVADNYSGKYFWMPPSGKVVKSYIECATQYHVWDAPAGILRGKMQDVIDIAFNPNQKEADYIYLNGWNYAMDYPIEGHVVEGQKTFQSEATALDRINVRRLMLWIERSIMQLGKYFTYEHNTTYNRQRFADQVSSVLEKAKNGYGLSEYAVKCDDDLNTTETIDRNELHCKIAVKPIKTIEFICISFVLTNQSADVHEEVMK